MTTRTFPAALAIGIAQHTTRGTERPFVPMTNVRWPERVLENCGGYGRCEKIGFVGFKMPSWAEGFDRCAAQMPSGRRPDKIYEQ